MGYVYILRSGNENLFKIGKTIDVEERIRGLTTGNPRLAVYDTIETEDEDEWETFFKKRLRSKRFRGSSAEEFFVITPESLKTIIQEAREFLPSFLRTRQAADRLADEKSTEQMVAPSAEDTAIYERLLEVREQEDRCHYERLHLENKLKLAIGTAAGLEGMALWKTRVKQKFDQTAFRKGHEDLYQEYATIVNERPFLPRASWAQPDREEEVALSPTTLRE